MLFNIIHVIGLYTAFYLVFTFLGFSFSRVVFGPRTYLTNLLAPLFGLSLFCLISTALMNHFTGALSGRLGLLVTVLLSAGLYCINPGNNPPCSLKSLSRRQILGYLAGLIFLLPLLITGDFGIFALNGADFGSYAGWGQYFQNYTLHDALPHTDPINFTQKAFTNLQIEITRPGGHWRIGNISLFAALCALLPSYWATLYTTCIAFFMGQFILAMQLFARITLFQRLKNSVILGACAILLNTIFWLAAAHYIPNIIGLTLTLVIVSLFLMCNRFRFRFALGMSVLLGTLLLLYPENLIFIPGILLLQIIIRDKTLPLHWIGNLRKNKIFIAGLVFVVSAALAYVWTFESFFRCIRHLIGILGYERPGDYVGIDFWAYLSQGIGFIDYNAILRNNDIFWDAGLRPDSAHYWHNNIFWLHTVLVVNYIAASILLIFGVTLKTHTKRTLLQKKSCCVLLAILAVLSAPILQYYLHEEYLLAWRSLLTISPYVWLLTGIAALNAISFVKKPALSQHKFRHGFALAAIVSFVILLSTATTFRLYMIKYIAYGATHAAIFGESHLRSAEYLQALKKPNDIAFLDYEGSGTIQAGWEYYLQNIAYIFPQHGSGRNEYSITPLMGKNVVILSDKYPKVYHLNGFTQTASNFRGRRVLLTENNNVLQIYSSTWIYLRDLPGLLLPGMPGKLLLWMKGNSEACLKMSLQSATRGNAYVRVTVNETNAITKSIPEINQSKLCYSFHKGLNDIRLEPIFVDQATLSAQQKYIASLFTKKTMTEDEEGLYNFYKGITKPVNPLISPVAADWGKGWNLQTPPDQFPLNPYLVFTNIEVDRA